MPTAPVFLATTALEEFWDTSCPVLFLSESCRRFSRRFVWQSLRAEVVPGPWNDNGRRCAAYRYIDTLYELLLPKIAAALNQMHGENRSVRYWRIVIGYWLYIYLSVLYDRYTRLSAAFDLAPELTTIGLADECHVLPMDTLEFVLRVRTDEYNLQIITRILTRMGKDPPRRPASMQFDSRAEFDVNASRFLNLTKKGASALARWLLHRKIGPESVVLHQSFFSRMTELLFFLKSSGAIVPWLDAQTGKEPIGPINDEARWNLADIDVSGDEFARLMSGLLPDDVPYCFVEGYEDLKRTARQYPVKPAAIFSANSWFYAEAFKHWAACSAETGTRLLVSQHGGGFYGCGKYFPTENHEIRIADRFYTWGWRPGGAPSDKVTPMPANLLTGRRSIGDGKEGGAILYVSTAEPRYGYWLQTLTEHLAEYLEWQRRFWIALPGHAQTATKIRLYPVDYGWDIEERWRDFAPTARLESCATPFFASLSRCRLYVGDHMGTTFCEAMAANKPSILFFSHATNPIRPESQTYFDELRTAEIVYDSPEDAAEAVARVHNEIDAWWQSPSRQAVRRNFCHRFARNSSAAIDDWISELMEMSRRPAQ